MGSLENVADLIERPSEKFVAQPRYVSKYRESVKRAAKRGKSAHKTLGVPSVNLNPPTEYLKKNSSGLFAKRPEVHHQHYRRPGYQHKLPDWQPVKASDKEITQNHSIDFTKRNIDEAKNLQPLKARKYYVDDKRGNSQALKTSGLYPVYINRKNYGKVPGEDSNLPVNRSKLKERNSTSPHHPPRDNKSRAKNHDEKTRNKTQVERKFQTRRAERSTRDSKKAESTENDLDDETEENEKAKDTKIDVKSTKSGKSSVKKDSYDSVKDNGAESIESSRPQQPRCRYVTEEERAELLYGMKKKWDEMMRQFQCLPFLTDTPPKAVRKSRMEKDLHQLEKDIEVIERHPYIYVYSDVEECP